MQPNEEMIYKTTLITFMFVLFGSISLLATPKCVYHSPLQIKSSTNGNILSWKTASEEGIRMFVVEKSTNGIDFRRAGDVKGAGYSKTINRYRFLDLASGNKNTYYRLLHYSRDGSFTISETFFMGQKVNNIWVVSSVSSTLTNNELKVTLKSKKSASVNYEIRNAQGKVVKSGTKELIKGNNSLAVNCKAFANGQYNIVFKSSSFNDAKINIKKVNSSEVPPVDYTVVHP